VDIKTEKKNDANILIQSDISLKEIDKRIDKLAAEAGKQMKVDGFRKGKVPPHVVKKLYGEKLTQDAESETVRDMISRAYKDLGIDHTHTIGDPLFKKYEKGEESLHVEMQICLRPDIEAKDYKKCIPPYEVPKAEEKEIEERIAKLAEQAAPLESIKEDRALAKNDTALFDFTGYVDGKAFEGGHAEDYELEIGSGQFIPGFEDQMTGMKKGEKKRITIKFPDNYQAENLRGKNAEFDIFLKDIKTKSKPEINDETAKKITRKDDATLETLRLQTKEQIEAEKLGKLYNEELKPKLLEALVDAFDFDLPENIVEQEIDNLANQKARTMKKEEIEALKQDSKKLEELRESVRDDAIRSVKATFIVDAVAKAEGVDATDQEVSQTLYYEAMMAGQDPEALLEYYRKNNLFNAVKMGMIEDKLFARLLDLDKKGGK